MPDLIVICVVGNPGRPALFIDGKWCGSGERGCVGEEGGETAVGV